MPKTAICSLQARTETGNVLLNWFKSTPFYDAKDNSEFEAFSVYRMECPDFRYNCDTREYFSGIPADDTELIYHGPVECTDQRKYHFIDEHAETGMTYAYFVASKTLPPVGPVPVKKRNPQVWWTYEELERQINALLEKHPDKIEKNVCGKTVEGRDIFALKVGRGKPSAGFIGAVHPGEAGPELIISILDKYLEENPEITKNHGVAAIPSLNIDMRERLARGNPWYLRVNAAGVDLNRNFPAGWDKVLKTYGLSTGDRDSVTYRGPFPASESETQAAMNFFSTNTPNCIFSFHALAGICLLPLLASGGIDKADAEFYKKTKHYAKAYATGLIPDIVEQGGYWFSCGCTEGSFPMWCWRKLGIPAFDLELSRRVVPEMHETAKSDLVTPEIISRFAEMHFKALKNIIKLVKSS